MNRGALARWVGTTFKHDSRVWKNVSALYAAQGVRYLVPLLTVPYLSRTLGPAAFGRYAFAQAIGLYVFFITDYGFSLSATRDATRARNAPDELSDLLSGVTGAKLAIGAGCIALAEVLQCTLPQFRHNGNTLLLGALWGASLSLQPVWMFLGIERAVLPTAIDMISRAVSTLLIFMLVHGPSDASLALVLQIGGFLVSALIATVIAFRYVTLRAPSLCRVRRAVRRGWSFFVFRMAISMYGSSNTIVLSFVAPGAAVGFYAAAEKASRLLLGLFDPLLQALYPSANRAASADRLVAARAARVSVVGLTAAGLIAAILVYASAPRLVPVLLGPGFEPTERILQILSLLLPLLGMSTPLATQWLFPLGLESVVARIAASAAFIHLVVATSLAFVFSAQGAAWAIVCTETYVVTMLWFVLVRGDVNPFSRSFRSSHPSTLILASGDGGE
jgi:PST family polysaccharide transporter